MREIVKKMEEIVMELKSHKAFIQAQCTLLKDLIIEVKEIKRGIKESGKLSEH